MTIKLTVKEHLANEALYSAEPSAFAGSEWKTLLLGRYSPENKLTVVLRDEPSWWITAASIALPVLTTAFAAASFLGFIHPAAWPDGLFAGFASKTPVIGLEEGLLLAALVNAAAFLLKDSLSELL